ncbi:MAG TPA: hypothetical protein VNP94_02750, partial [Actinomycetota bacterium]|nr:hypothetical protein [Actinomycetota bacterium]
MPDNVVANAGSGGATFATDDIGGVHYPRSKVVWGSDGAATDTADAPGARLPVRVGEDGVGLAKDATLTGGSAKAIVRGGAKGVTAAGDITGENVSADVQALHVNLKGSHSTVPTDPSDRAARQLGRVFLRNPADSANMGDATTPVRVDPTGTTTQPVSGTVAANLNAGSNLVGKVQLRNPGNTADLGDATNPVRVDPTGTTAQPVSQSGSWTVTANAGTGPFPNQQTNVTADYDTGAGVQTVTMFGLALPASGGAVPGGTATAPVRVDPTGTTTQPVSGTVTANQGGTWTVGLNAGGNLVGRVQLRNPADTANLGDATNPVRVDPTGTTTQPVSGTVTANQGGTWSVNVANSPTVVDGGAGKTLKRAVVSLTATGTVVAAVSGRRIKVYQYAIQSRNDGMTVRFRDGGAGANLGLDWSLNTREGAQSGPVNPPAFIFGTSAGNSLDAVVSGTG